jgi:hypothetical protein
MMVIQKAKLIGNCLLFARQQQYLVPVHVMKIQHRTSLQATFVFFSVGASICKPFAETTFEQATYVKNIYLFNQIL